MKAEKEKLKELRQKHSREEINKKKLAAYVVISVFLAGSLTLVPELLESDQISRPEPDVTVNITEEGVDPFRPVISEGDHVEFVNKANIALEMSFDRDVETFVLEPGGSRVKEINSIIYYNVNSAEGQDFREIKAGINVQ